MSKGQGGEFTLRGPQGREFSRTVEPRLWARDSFCAPFFIPKFHIFSDSFLRRDLGGPAHLDAAPGALQFEQSVNLLFLVLVLDLVAAEGDALGDFFLLPRRTEFSASPTQGEVAGRLFSRVEMLVKPAVRRDDDASRVPIELLFLTAFEPEQGIAVAAENDHVGARSVAVRVLVSAGGKLRDVSAHGVIGDLEHDGGATRAPLFPLDELEVVDVRDKVGVPNPAWVCLAFTGKVIVLSAVAVGEDELVVEDEIVVVEQVHDQRHVGDRQEARRLAAGAVEVLIPGVEGRRKKTSFLPLKGFLFSFPGPYRRSAPSAQDEDQLLEDLPLRNEIFSRQDLANIRVVGLPDGRFSLQDGTVQIDVHAFSSHARPRF